MCDIFSAELRRMRAALYEKRHRVGVRGWAGTPGKRVGVKASREFESRPVRQLSAWYDGNGRAAIRPIRDAADFDGCRRTAMLINSPAGADDMRAVHREAAVTGTANAPAMMARRRVGLTWQAAKGGDSVSACERGNREARLH